jgi:NTE family protein
VPARRPSASGRWRPGGLSGGAYAGLAEVGYQPDWVAGISIGAINAAIIAGNPPERRVERLTRFWKSITREHGWLQDGGGDAQRRFLNAYSAAETVLLGVGGFFAPRAPNLLLGLPNLNPETSYYDTAPLRRTLEELVDFDLINEGPVRLSVGAVNVETGNFRYFDSKFEKIVPEHIMASGALPPGFPAVEVEDGAYWDGGLVSNTPLAVVLEDRPRVSTLCFQVDLFPAKGPRPRSMGETEARQKDIRYSSRTRLNTNEFRERHRMRHLLRQVIEMLPAELQKSPEIREILPLSCTSRMHIAHLIYRPEEHELESKDYEFSRSTMSRRWRDGYEATCGALNSPQWRKRPTADAGVAVYDLTNTADRDQSQGNRKTAKKTKTAAPATKS